MTTTCLTAAASAVAFAGIITEPVGGFGKVFPGTLLPTGTTEVDGSASLNNGSNEYYEFQGLPGGASLSSISFSFLNDSSSRGFGVELLSDADSVVTAEAIVPENGTYDPTGTIPADGFLVVDIKAGNETATPYVLTLSPGASVPEPGTLAALGLGLAGLGAIGLRRRIRKA